MHEYQNLGYTTKRRESALLSLGSSICLGKIMITVMTGGTGTSYVLGEKSLNSCYCFCAQGVTAFCFGFILLASWSVDYCYEGEIPPHRIPSLGCGCISA